MKIKKIILVCIITVLSISIAFSALKYNSDAIDLGNYVILKNENNYTKRFSIDTEEVKFSYPHITRIVKYNKYLPKFKSLKNLYVECNSKSDLSVFSKMDSLEVLYLIFPESLDNTDVDVIDLSDLSFGKTVHTIYIVNMSHHDILLGKPDNDISDLKKLYIYCDYSTIINGCKDISSFTYIENLYLKCPPSIDLSGIEELEHLKTLAVFSNKYSGLDTLSECQSLSEITIKIHTENDIRQLLDDPVAERLYLQYNNCYFGNDVYLPENDQWIFMEGYYHYRNIEPIEGDYVEPLHIDSTYDLSKMSKLKELCISNIVFDDIEPLKKIPHLENIGTNNGLSPEQINVLKECDIQVKTLVE